MDIIRVNPNRQSIPASSLPPPAASEPRFRFPKIKWRAPIAVIVILALIVSGLYLFLPQAVITVKARTEPVARNFEIKVSQNVSEPSSADLAVPGKMIERELAGSKKYGATGTKNVGKTASGFVSIYNFSKTTLILKAQTTVLTANGRKYYFTQDAPGIRPTARIGGPGEDEEIDETSLVPPVPLVAASAGEEYNLTPGTRLEIDNEAFGAQPQKLYAVAGEGITGGTTKLAKFVTQGDIDSAYKALTAELLDQSREELLAGNPNIRVLDNAFTTEILEQQSPARAGAEVSEFEVSAKVSIRALSFDQNDVQKIVFDLIKRLLPEEKILSESGSVLDVSFLSLSLSEAAGVLSAHFEGKIVYRLDQGELLEKVRGKSAEEIREIFLSKPEVDSLEVQFSPFWVKSAPKMRGKIKIITAA